jgi:hypothetical protein
MTESEYYAGEIADADLDALADAGDFYLEESGFYYMPSSDELQKLTDMGEALLFFNWFKTL